MSTTKKGTPRKRPYDVKRKLERAIARFKKQGKQLTYGGYGDLGIANGKWEVKPGGCGCALTAYLDGRPSTDDIVRDLQAGLGLETTGEICALWGGFDYPEYASGPWGRVGKELRAEHLG